ncbi:MAG: diphthamide biosynthesis enzyme Dph2 [Nitrososphaerota archaeon]|nr:diphthamide biosynthesis enzyme Dph2 [Candidatus Bathyarchaeota archaeon]MDW8061707.1 diphthamide biosynthesis enzyme Dph2 [Nitrososphaerota archaeon]
MFTVDYEKISAGIERYNPRCVLIQAPEGFSEYALKLADLIRDRFGCRVYVSADPCFGACMLPYDAARKLSVDLIIHMGHAAIPGMDSNRVLYVEVRSDLDVKQAVSKAMSILKGYRKIGLVTIVQHIGKLMEAKRILEEYGKIVYIGKPRFRAIYEGQILGCDTSAAEDIADDVDAFLYIGGGLFHPLGVALATGKPTFAVDPFTLQVTDLKDVKRRFLAKRYASIVKAVDARIFGILLGLQPGQMDLDKVREIEYLLREHGKTVYILPMHIFDPDILSSFRSIEVFVNTACPRLALEDSFRIDKPVLNPSEVMVALGVRRWDELFRDT